MKKILILASWRMPHVRRFIENIGKIKGNELEIDFLDNTYGIENLNCKALNHVYTIDRGIISSIILKIPRIRMIYVSKKVCSKLEDILSNEKYSLVNMLVVHSYAPEVVDICKRNHTKILLSPFGSEVIRINEKKKELLKSAFKNADYIGTKENSSFSEYLISTFEVNKSQFVSYGAGSETITAILNNQGKFSREEMSKRIGIPYSTFNICCGYNAQKAQRHSEMLSALAKNKGQLPNGYQIIIPLAYGNAKKELLKSLRKQADELGLSVVFLMDYLSVDDLSFLRMVTDLFIHVQTTDAANASLQEFILAGAKCINGKWLSYPYLETDGMPYYQCPSIEELPETLKYVLINKDEIFKVPDSTISEIKNNAYDRVIDKWKMFFLST